MVPKQSQEKNDWQRDTQQPKQRALTEIHFASPSLQKRKTLSKTIGSFRRLAAQSPTHRPNTLRSKRDAADVARPMQLARFIAVSDEVTYEDLGRPKHRRAARVPAPPVSHSNYVAPRTFRYVALRCLHGSKTANGLSLASAGLGAFAFTGSMDP